MEVTAKLRYYRQSPRKVRLVANLIRGLDVKPAVAQLQFLNKTAALAIAKLVNSAIANATHNFSLNSDNLYIKSIMVDGGPTLKRWRARAFGRAAAIRKHTSHVTVILNEKNPTKPIIKSVKTEPVVDEIRSPIDSAVKNQETATAEKTQSKTSEPIKTKGYTPSRSGKSLKKGFMPKIFQRKAG